MFFFSCFGVGVGEGLLAAPVTFVARFFSLAEKHRQALATAATAPVPNAPEIDWRRDWRNAIALALLAWVPILLSYGIVVVPSGTAGGILRQTTRTPPPTLSPPAPPLTPPAPTLTP